MAGVVNGSTGQRVVIETLAAEGSRTIKVLNV
jgi:hypothetical protein